MKTPSSLALSLLLPVTVLQMQATTVGFVFCDSNQNGQFDNGDTPMPGVLVVVTNTSGTFSNANWTATPDGGFFIPLGTPPDSYVEYIEPATLPSDALIVQPSGGIYMFTTDANNPEFSGNFLISSSTCTNGAPPPPPPPTNGMSCCLHASGSICGPGHKPAFTFSGTALPSCGSTNGDTGEWKITASGHKLHFEGSVFEIVNCGQDEDAAGNSFNFIEFQGAGTLKGFGGCKANYGVVYFFAHAEDHGHFCKAPDSLYFHVYAADGSSLLLIGGDDNDPTNIVPVALSAGHLVIGTNCCQTCDHGEGGEQGEHSGEGNGNCHQHPGNNGDDHGAGDDNGSHGNGHGDQGHGKGGDDNGAGDDKGGKGNGQSTGNCNQATSHGNGNSAAGHMESGHANGKSNGSSANNHAQGTSSGKSNHGQAGGSSKNNHGHGG